MSSQDHGLNTVAEPGALGLFGLAMVTLVASSQKLGFTSGVSYVIPWAIFLGSFAQLFACASDSKRMNIFGTTAFGAYGLFWLGVATSWLMKMGVFGTALATAVDTKQLAVAFFGYLVFTLFMTVAALETNKVLFWIFVCIDFLFLGLALSTLGIAEEATHALAAYSELIISVLSFYGSGATVINIHFGKEVLPLGRPFGIFNLKPESKKITKLAI